MVKKKHSSDNFFDVPKRRGRPPKPKNPFELDFSLDKKPRGRPTKPKGLFDDATFKRKHKTKSKSVGKSKITSPQNETISFHPATQLAMVLSFLPALLCAVMLPSLTNFICMGSLILFPVVLVTLHQYHRNNTLIDVTNSLHDTHIYAPSVPSSTPSEFEHEVAWLFNILTPYQARVVGGSGDGGVDVEIFNHGQLIGIAQCKKYDPNKALPPAPIRELYAVMHQKNVSIGYLFTTARVTQQTLDEATRLGVKVVYGAQLLDMRHQARQKSR